MISCSPFLHIFFVTAVKCSLPFLELCFILTSATFTCTFCSDMKKKKTLEIFTDTRLQLSRFTFKNKIITKSKLGKSRLDLTISLRIDNLQNYCLGSSRGKSRLLRWLSRWLHSHLHHQRLHSSSVFPSEVAAVSLSGCLWISLQFLIMMPNGDHWFVLGQ